MIVNVNVSDAYCEPFVIIIISLCITFRSIIDGRDKMANFYRFFDPLGGFFGFNKNL